jgi:tryptophanyl-tRNA synthetase
MKQRILAGIRASGRLHVGNYFGALKNWVALQDTDYEICVFMIADYHGITTPYDPKTYPAQVTHTAIEFLESTYRVGMDL